MPEGSSSDTPSALNIPCLALSAAPKATTPPHAPQGPPPVLHMHLPVRSIPSAPSPAPTHNPLPQTSPRHRTRPSVPSSRASLSRSRRNQPQDSESHSSRVSSRRRGQSSQRPRRTTVRPTPSWRSSGLGCASTVNSQTVLLSPSWGRSVTVEEGALRWCAEASGAPWRGHGS